MRRLILSTLSIFFVLLAWVPASAQTGRQPPPKRLPPAELKYIARGHEVPRFTLTQEFLGHAAIWCQDPHARDWLLGELSLLGHPVASEAFLDFVEHARQVVNEGLDPVVLEYVDDKNMLNRIEFKLPGDRAAGPDPETNPEAFDASMRARETAQAQEIGRLLGELEITLRELGHSILPIDDFIDRYITPSVQVLSDLPIQPDHRDAAFAAGKAFAGSRKEQ